MVGYAVLRKDKKLPAYLQPAATAKAPKEASSTTPTKPQDLATPPMLTEPVSSPVPLDTPKPESPPNPKTP